MQRFVFILFITFFCFAGICQKNRAKNDSIYGTLHFRRTLLPLGLIAGGFITTYDPSIRKLNTYVKSKVWGTGHPTFHADDYLQYTPGIAVFGMSALGFSGKNKLLDQTLLLAGSYAIMGITVNGLKYSTKIERPDGSSLTSFPSGHTATAFMMAEFLHQEYGHRSLLFSLGGYAVATSVGYLRMYNNRHWVADVMCGAGLGILSTKLFYYLYPRIKRKFTNNSSTTNSKPLTFYPIVGMGQAGISVRFHNSASSRQKDIFAKNLAYFP